MPIFVHVSRFGSHTEATRKFPSYMVDKIFPVHLSLITSRFGFIYLNNLLPIDIQYCRFSHSCRFSLNHFMHFLHIQWQFVSTQALNNHFIVQGILQVQGIYIRKFDIGSGNGLVPSDSEPLSKPMLTQIHVATWHHLATMSFLRGRLQYSIALIENPPNIGFADGLLLDGTKLLHEPIVLPQF